MKTPQISRAMKNNGFSLLELSVVLLILSVVVGSGFSIANNRSAQARIEHTQAMLDKIEAALINFRKANNRLPCPADASLPPTDANYGAEAANEGSCIGGTPAANFSAAENAMDSTAQVTEVVGGMVPIRAIGLEESDALDGWGNKITYHVDAKATRVNAFSIYPISSDKCFDIAIEDENIYAGAGTNTNIIQPHAVYVLVSHGENAHGAFTIGGARRGTNSPDTASSYSLLQNENADYDENNAATTYDNLFVDIDYHQAPNDTKNVFDDYLRYKSRSQLRTPQDGPGIAFPDLIAWSGNGTDNGLEFIYRCDRQFRTEASWISETHGFLAPSYAIDVTPSNKRIATSFAGTNDHFSVINFDGVRATVLPNTNYDEYPTGTSQVAQMMRWLDDHSFMVADVSFDSDFADEYKIAIYEEDENNSNFFNRKSDPFDVSSTSSDLFLSESRAVIPFLSPDRKQVLVARMGDPSTYAPELYSRDSTNRFTLIEDAFTPALSAGDTIQWVEWSDNMQYIGIAMSNSPYISIYRNEGNYTYSAGPTVPTVSTNINWVTFSPNGKFLALMDNSLNTRLYKLNPTTQQYDETDNSPLATNASFGMKFSLDGRFLAVTRIEAAAGNKAIHIFEINQDLDDYDLLTDPNGFLKTTTAMTQSVSIRWRNPMHWERKVKYNNKVLPGAPQ